MSTGRFSSYLIEGWIDDLEARPKWLTIVAADPQATANPYTAEVSGTALVRVSGTWARTGIGSLTLTSAISFPDLPYGAHVAGVAGFDAATGGNLLFADLLDEPKDYPSGGTYTLPGGQYVVGIDLPGT